MKKHIIAVFFAFGFLFALSQIGAFTGLGNAVLSVEPQFAESQAVQHSDSEIMWNETNIARQRYGLKPVALDAEMSCRAWEWAQHMRQVRNLYHSNIGFSEIIAMGYSAKRVVGNPSRAGGRESGWLASPGHRAIVLGRNYKRLGAAKAGRYTIEIFSSRTRNLRADCLFRHGQIPSPNSPYQLLQGA